MRTLIPIDKIDRTKFQEVRVCGEYVALLFSDGTACVVTDTRDGSVADAATGYVSLWERPLLGLITQEEFNAEIKERKDMDTAENLARNRQEYERLKKMFEGNE